MEKPYFASLMQGQSNNGPLVQATLDVLEALTNQRQRFVAAVAPSRDLACALLEVVRRGDVVCAFADESSVSALLRAVRIGIASVQSAENSEWAIPSGLEHASVRIMWDRGQGAQGARWQDSLPVLHPAPCPLPPAPLLPNLLSPPPLVSSPSSTFCSLRWSKAKRTCPPPET
jgi:hypothetical protein